MSGRLLGLALALVSFAIFALPGTAGTDRETVLGPLRAKPMVPTRVAIAPGLQYQLGVLARSRVGSRSRTADELGVQMQNGSVRVVLQTRDGLDFRRLAFLGARVEARVPGLVQAVVPVRALEQVAGLRGVRFVRRPSYQEPDAVPGEEVAATNASAAISRGWTGKGVRVAVIDSGFGGYQQRIAEGELPADVVVSDFCGGRFETNTEHGTAVAEIVHEMAPKAELYLICFDSDVGFAQAAAFAKSRRVHIITHSGSTFNNGRGDGAPLPGTEGAAVADARAAGILWVNSAGNSAQRHWSGSFTDSNGDGLHNFAPANEGNGLVIGRNDEVCVFLKWDEWPVAVSDFDLVLLNSSGVPVATSQTRQTGSQPPIEEICAYQNTGPEAQFYAAIRVVNAVGSPRFDMFVRNLDPPLQYVTPEGSIGDPGASPFAFAAGAICWQNNALEPYSGRGPTIDGRVKPDIAAQDSNSGATYGPFTACGRSGFTGTSASAPATAGAAALVKEQNPRFTAAQIQAFLEANGQDLGLPGKDNEFGSGRLFVPTPTRLGPAKRDTVKPRVRAIRSKGVRGKSVRLYSHASDDSGRVRIVATVRKGTRTLARITTGFAQTRPAGTYFVVWKAPAKISGPLRHCVQAFDRTGNKSGVSCAALVVTAV